LIGLTEQSAKELDWICFSRESPSNEIKESDRPHEKHDEPIMSTFRGILDALRNQAETVSDPICLSCEFCSNETDEIELQCGKHEELWISTLRGTVIDLRAK
jgi:hypothetical protein